MPQQPQIIKVTSPVKGVNSVTAREQQPPDTCWSAQNMLPYDKFGRRRIAQRPGLVKAYATQLGAGKIQAMLPVNNITYTGTFTSTGLTSTAASSFSHIPSTITAASNTLAWPTSYVPTSGNGGLGGVILNSTILNPVTFDFNLIFGGSSTTNAGNNLYISLNSPSTTWSNPAAGNDGIDLQWQYNPKAVTNNVNISININTSTGGFDFASAALTSTIVPGTSIPCSFTWASTGFVSMTMGALSCGTSTTPQTNQASTMQFFADGTGMQVSTNSMNFITGGTTTVSTGQAGYAGLLVAVCGGNVWIGDGAGNIGECTYSSTLPSTARINSTQMVSMAYARNSSTDLVFIADGSSTLWNVNLASSTISSTTPVPSPGSTTGSIPPNCNLICNWRGRIVLAGDANNPQNFYMARPAGTYGSTNTFIGPGVDWDYSQTDAAAAVAGNTAHAGQIGEPIIALIPFSDDYLKFGCSHSLWMAQGDPAAGGSIVNVSQNMGLSGKNAWAIDTAGTLWFAGTGGLYQVRPAWEFYRPPEPVSLQNVNQSFAGIDPGNSYVALVYDPDLHYLHNFVTSVTGTAGAHLTMDFRSVDQQSPPGFWPVQFPSTMGPTCACIFFGTGSPNTRQVLIGGWDGYIRAWNDTALDDDGTAISASVTLGPWNLAGGIDAATIIGVTVDMGESPISFGSTSWNVNAILAAGPDAYSVTEALPNNQNAHPQPSILSLTLDRRQKTFRQRLRGGWFSLALQNLTDDLFFSFESATIEFIPSGRNRVRR